MAGLEAGRKWHPLVALDREHGKLACAIGLHPKPGTRFMGALVPCYCGAYAATQCCEQTSCRKHKCGPRVGCRCPLPSQPETQEAVK